jgi:hypothetical protein
LVCFNVTVFYFQRYADSSNLSRRARTAPEPPSVAKARDADALPHATFPRFLHVPKDIPFVIYDDLLDRCIELIAFPDPGVAYEVVTLDPAIVQASRQFREKA